MEITPGELRTNAQKIQDEEIKRRVLRGIELLDRHVGPDWVDHIDPMSLSMCSGTYCVVGQVFSEEVPTEEEWEGYMRTPSGRVFDMDDRNRVASFSRGMAIINGSAAQEPHLFGFTDDGAVGIDYMDLDNAWRTVFGEGEVW